MAADNHLIQLAGPGLWGPDRSHWPTYDKSISTVNHIVSDTLHIVAVQYIDHHIAAAKVALKLAATLWRGRLKRIQIHSLITPAGSYKSGHGPLLSPLPERDLLQPACSLPFPLSSPLPLFSHLCLLSPLLPFSLLHFFATLPLFNSLSTSQCYWGSSTQHSVNWGAHTDSSEQVLIKPTMIYSWQTSCKWWEWMMWSKKKYQCSLLNGKGTEFADVHFQV